MEQTLDLTPFTMALREAFPEQVAFCGIQGSYGRGEAGPDSDVDLVVILEEAGARELERYRALIASMPLTPFSCCWTPSPCMGSCPPCCPPWARRTSP